MVCSVTIPLPLSTVTKVHNTTLHNTGFRMLFGITFLVRIANNQTIPCDCFQSTTVFDSSTTVISSVGSINSKVRWKNCCWDKGGKLSKRTKDNILATLTFQGHPIFSDDLPESEEGNSDESAKDLDESDDNSYSDSGDGSGE